MRPLWFAPIQNTKYASRPKNSCQQKKYGYKVY